MNILFAHEFFGAWGGAETNIYVTACELRSRGHAVALLHGRGTGKNEEGWRKAFSECFSLADGEGAMIGDGARVRSGKYSPVQKAIENFEPDIIYVHSLPDLKVFESLLNSGIPVVRMVHDHHMYCMRGYKYNYFTRRICNRSASLYCIFPCLASVGRNSGGQGLKWVSYSAKRKEISLNQRCERVVAYSEYSKAELVRNGFDANKIYIHVPIRCESAETPVSSFSDRNLLIYTGQIIRGKGVDVLLRSLEKISVPFECVILGEGNHRPYCERLCTSLGLDDRVKFAGFVPQDELKRFYAEASLCVMSSVWPEPFGMVGPEAMRYGLPVVAFDAGGIREWLTDRENGFLVPWMNTDLFAARVEELLQNKELARQMGQRGRVRVLREYEAARQVNGLEHMFESLVENACDQRAFVKLDARERGMSSAAVARVITTPGTENGDEVEGVLANERAELLPASETSISL